MVLARDSKILTSLDVLATENNGLGAPILLMTACEGSCHTFLQHCMNVLG